MLVEAYETVTVAITAEHYWAHEESLQDALTAAIGNALAADDQSVKNALGIDAFDAFYNEDELYPDTNTVDDDMAIQHGDQYTIAQVKTEPTDDHRAGVPLPEHQVDTFEARMERDDRPVAAKYTIIGQCDDAGAIAQAFASGERDTYRMTCRIRAIPTGATADIGAGMAMLDTTPTYLKDGTRVDRPTVGRLTTARLTVRAGPGQVGPDDGIPAPLTGVAA